MIRCIDRFVCDGDLRRYGCGPYTSLEYDRHRSPGVPLLVLLVLVDRLLGFEKGG